MNRSLSGVNVSSGTSVCFMQGCSGTARARTDARVLRVQTGERVLIAPLTSLTPLTPLTSLTPITSLTPLTSLSNELRLLQRGFHDLRDTVNMYRLTDLLLLLLVLLFFLFLLSLYILKNIYPFKNAIFVYYCIYMYALAISTSVFHAYKAI